MMCSITPEYEQFKVKHKEWIECLSGKDRHSVSNQIIQMIWNAAVFRVINEARLLAPTDDKGGVQLNGMIHRFINESFFISQATAIRRLADKSSISGKRSVFSLIGLLDDMAKPSHLNLMTREHLFAVDGLEYDSKPVEEAYHKYCEQNKGSCSVPPNLFYGYIDRRHERIDKLADVAPSQRSKNDSIRPEVIIKLRKMVWNACESVAEHVNKFVAHAASHENRQQISPDGLEITLGHLWKAHEVIYKVANFVSIYLLDGNNLGGLAIPQYEQFEYIDRPLVNTENIQNLKDKWQQYDKETNDWEQWGLDEFETETI